jgi:hypothetical protein
MSSAKPKLAWLANELGIDKSELKESDNFDARLRFQKVSFLLNHLGVDPLKKFTFNLYLRGPYSPGLAAQYYDLNGDNPEPINLTKHEHELLNWFAGFDLKQMEVASSIMLIQGFSTDKVSDEDIYSVLTVSKPWVEKDDFERIIGELRQKGLVK